MAKRTEPPVVSDSQIRDLLERYHCPTPFHAVRTRLLGDIASLDPQASPMKALEALWGGELPVFDSTEDLNQLIGGLVMGLWNRLSRHQERSVPFRLMRIEAVETQEGAAQLAQVRLQELDGFVEGLFGGEDSLDLPERAHRALLVLAQTRAVLEAARTAMERAAEPGESIDAAGTLREFRGITQAMEHEMHEAVLACTRARRTAMRLLRTARPPVH